MRRPAVLMYHAFSWEYRRDPHNLFVTEASLRAQVRMLRQGRWRTLDLDGYLRARAERRDGRSVLVTVDDGFRSFLEVGAPVLAEAGIPSVLFVCPALLGGLSAWMKELPDEQIVAADELRALVDLGVEIGAHGLDHRLLPGLDAAELVRQTRGAWEQLADLTGTPPRAFAYPWGAFDDRARQAVAAAGFRIAFSVFRDAGPLAISRADVNGTDDARTFRLKLMPTYRPIWRTVAPLRRARRALRSARP